MVELKETVTSVRLARFENSIELFTLRLFKF